MLARHTVETERWSESDHGVLTDADRNHSALQLATGLSAAYTGRLDEAEVALANIRSSRQRFERKASTAYRARIIAVEENARHRSRRLDVELFVPSAGVNGITAHKSSSILAAATARIPFASGKVSSPA